MGKRILLKLSGEALKGSLDYGIESEMIVRTAKEVKKAVDAGNQIALVTGAGNIFRGVSGSSDGVIPRPVGDSMGMLATVMNCLAMQSALESIGQKAVVLSAVYMQGINEAFNRKNALEYLNDGKVVLFSGGTGNPFFTTDSAAALRACEIDCDMMIKGTKVNGIYDSDPEINKNAVKYDEITYDEAISKGLKVMDGTSIMLAKENNMPLLVFNMKEEGNLAKVLNSEGEFTIVKA